MNLAGLLNVKPFTCPNCRQELPLADVNMAEDMALCRACGYTGPFLSSSRVPRLSDEEIANPPKRVKLARGFGDTLTITCQPRRGGLLFLIPFTLLWSGFSLGGIYGQQIWNREFDLTSSLFGLPFLLGTVVLLGAIFQLLFGKTTIQLSPGKAQIKTNVLGWRRTREIEITSATTVSLQKSSYKVNDVAQMEIVVNNDGEVFRFGAWSLTQEAVRYVAGVLQRVIGGK